MIHKTLVAIPIYNLRNSELVDFFRTCEPEKINNFDIVLFSSHNDLNDYSYIPNNNVKLESIFIPDDVIEVNIIGYKRQQILEYARKNNYTYCVMIDDDIHVNTAMITKESKRTTSNSYRHIKINIIDNINKMINTIQEYDATFCSCNYLMYLSFSEPGLVKINERINCMQFYMFRVNDIFENNIKYTWEEELNEDIDIVLQILQHGLKCVTIMDYAFSENKKGSTIHKNEKHREGVHIGTFKKWHTKLYIDKKGIIRTKMNWKKYYNTYELPEFDKLQQRIYDIIVNKEPYEVLYNTLKNKKI